MIPTGPHDVLQDEDMMMMDFHHPPEEQEALSNDEAHDQLGDLPFNGGRQIRPD
jgi:hypothetical protein